MSSNSAANMKISKISKKLIKPHTPTPPNLKNYYLSLLDRFVPPVNFSFVLLYESKPENNLQLEESLAKILVQFYPLAGRYIKNDPFVDCSDQGALFVEAEALDVELATDLVVKNIEIQKLKNLFPDQDFQSDAPNPLLSIQVTHFPSGGLAIAFLVSHTVFDMSSFGTFLASWSSATNPDGKIAFTPSFDLPSLLPYRDVDFGNSADQSTSKEDGKLTSKDGIVVAKRLVFDKVALTRLRSKLSPNRNGKTISRLRVVCAVIANALIGLDSAKHGRTRDFVIFQPVNMRERTTTSLPKHACGNLAMPSSTRCVAASDGKEIGMQELVDLMGYAIEKTIVDHAEILSPDRDGRDIIINTVGNFIKQHSNLDTNNIILTDWSKFGFYEANFGWGKPVWMSTGPQLVTNAAILQSTKDGDGIEALVFLNQDDVHYFEQDEEINYFAT